MSGELNLRGYRSAKRLVQGLVYIFIALAALGVAGAAYFGLTFSPIEAIVSALAFGAVAVMLMERTLRQRSEARLERAIEDLGRLLSTDAQAGAVLSQRINAIADTNAGSRLDGIEADISVLGTVVRQLAEAVAEMEEQRRTETGMPPPAQPAPEPRDEDHFPEPVIPVEMLKQALNEHRLICHIEPVVQLPQRRPSGYDLVPRLILEDGELAEPADFMPRAGHAEAVRQIEGLMLDEAVTITRRARTAGQPTRLHVPLSRASLADAPTVDQLLATLDANRAIADTLVFVIGQSEFKQMLPSEKATLGKLGHRSATFSLAQASSLRFDFGELEGLGFSTVRFDATRFLRNPEFFTDFHTADIAPYAKRFHIDLVATGVIDEQQLLSLFEDGVLEVQGPHVGRPGPVREDLIVDRSSSALRERA